MPEAEGIQHFGQGVSKLSGQWMGRESREVARYLLPIAAGQKSSKVHPDLVHVTRAILEFTYCAHASRMMDEDIDRLEVALHEFHQYKHVLVGDKRPFKDNSRFDAIAKLHMLSHHPESICEMGTPDGFSTKGPEHLHIESVKRLWDRFLGLASHRKGPRKSRVVYNEDEDEPEPEGVAAAMANSEVVKVVKEDEAGRLEEEDKAAEGEKVQLKGDRGVSDAKEHVVYPNPTLSIARRLTAGLLRGLDIISNYGTTNLIPVLHLYLKNHATRKNYPTTFLPTTHHKYNVWHCLYLYHQPLPLDPENVKCDVVRA
ncbi:hypothetical protein FRC06_007493 [Ceratobasidium sp. 370]|nr:hypothetical protein FRC06_007493 [Ceratobasidium sp. 370]